MLTKCKYSKKWERFLGETSKHKDKLHAHQVLHLVHEGLVLAGRAPKG